MKQIKLYFQQWKTPGRKRHIKGKKMVEIIWCLLLARPKLVYKIAQVEPDWMSKSSAEVYAIAAVNSHFSAWDPACHLLLQWRIESRLT